jgi:AcrR family transcriptional regulator
MAEHGIEGVDLKAIHAAAGQRNRSAVAYHFGDRNGLVRAIGAKHRALINPVRHRMVDRLERRGEVGIPELVDALVLPLAGRLDDPSGRDYIIILAEAASRLGTAGLYQARGAHTDSVQRVAALMLPRLHGSTKTRRLLIGQAILTVPVLLADIARSINTGGLTLAQGKRRARETSNFITGGVLRVGDRRPT